MQSTENNQEELEHNESSSGLAPVSVLDSLVS